MTKKTKIFMTAWSVLVLISVLVNILIGLGNQSIQAEVTERQQEIAQTIQLEALNRPSANQRQKLRSRRDYLRKLQPAWHNSRRALFSTSLRSCLLTPGSMRLPAGIGRARHTDGRR